MWVAIEGIDYAGKTTVLQALAKELKSQRICGRIQRIRFPGETLYGADIRDILEKYQTADETSNYFLFMADMIETYQTVIRPHPHTLFLSDRSIMSTLVYQGYIASIDQRLIAELYSRFCEWPDLTVLLTISEKEYNRRKAMRKDVHISKYEDLWYSEKTSAYTRAFLDYYTTANSICFSPSDNQDITNIVSTIITAIRKLQGC